MSKRVIALLLAALTLVVVAGCGSDDGDEGGEETLTKVEFIKQGDKICEEATERAEAEGPEFAEENGFDLEKATNEQLEEAITAVVVPVLNGQIEDLDALGAPEGDEETIEEMIVALEDGVAEVEEDPSVVMEGEPLKEATTIAEDYGFEVCGEE